MFEKGHKCRGRPSNSRNKAVFNLQDIINNRFPGHKNVLETKIRQLDTAKSSPGRELLRKYYSGGKLTPIQSIKAQCCDCESYYDDGKVDCENPLCPNYPYMPYRVKEKKSEKSE